MMSNGNFKSESSGQTIILAGFVIAVIIVGLGTILNSVAISGQQSSPQLSDASFDYFNNVREEYGNALMISSDYGELNPFNSSTLILEFEDRMKTIMEFHGNFVGFTWTNESYDNESKRASVNILFSDGNKNFNDTVMYNLVTGKIIYDVIPPGDIDDLYVKQYLPSCDDVYDGAVLLNWTATGDDGDVGAASRYDIRYSNESIDTQAKFEGATKKILGTSPLSSGQQENHVLDFLPPGDWYFAMIVYDEAGNPSNLTKPVSGNDHAVVSNYSAYINQINAENGSYNGEADLIAGKNEDINITFRVSNEDRDNITVHLMMRNRTISGTNGTWFEAANWTNYNYSMYNNTEFNYTFNNGMEHWDYYINASVYHAMIPCYQYTSTSSNVSWDYYSIDLLNVTMTTKTLNGTYVNDTFIDNETASSNYGNNSKIKLFSWAAQNKYKYGLIRFNLSSIPTSATIISANISLYLNTTDANQETRLYRVLEPWNENDVTWDNWYSTDNYSTSYNTSGQITIDYYRYNWSAFTDVDYFHNNRDKNYGWLIKVSATNGKPAEFDSKESSNSPMLIVQYYE